jgi:hypothetical protein
MAAMIVQNAPDGAPHFVIAMHQHTAFAGSLASHFGNDHFVGLEPAEPMQFVVSHHDQGWTDLDATACQNPETGLPYNLTATPLTQVISTSAGSPAFNEDHHPFSGIISSMHTYGLYNGRYGLTDKIFLDRIPEELRPDVDSMLANELERQDRLRTALEGSDPGHATDDFLLHAYRQLQFFDTLSLHLHLNPEGSRGDTDFPNVPQALGDDVTISLTERDTGVYALSPYPFNTDALEVYTEGRYLEPQPVDTDLGAALAATEVSEQHVRFVAA